MIKILGPALLSAEDITVSYGSNSTLNELDGVSVSFVPGQITAIVGPNGSGKSTLVRALSRVLQPRRGAVLLDGRDLYRELTARQSAQSIGVAPQDTHVAFDFTGRDVVAMGRAPHNSGWTLFAGESAADSIAIDKALERAELSPELARRPVMSLSGGERQRVLIARALVQEAEIILLDEPTASLDIAHQVNLFGRLRTLADVDNKAVVIVLHDLSQAAAFADRLVVLNSGKIVADGPVAQVLTRELVRTVYQCGVQVAVDVATGRLTVTTMPISSSRPRLSGKRVYVICGGGGGAETLRKLKFSGADVFASWLNEGDIDCAAGVALDIPFSKISAFEPVPEMTETEVEHVARSCDAIIFTPAAVGSNNLAALTNAFRLANAGGNIFAVDPLNNSFSGNDLLLNEMVEGKIAELLVMPQTIRWTDSNQLITLLEGEIRA